MDELTDSVAQLQTYINDNIQNTSTKVSTTTPTVEEVFDQDWVSASLVDDLARECGLKLPPISLPSSSSVARQASLSGGKSKGSGTASSPPPPPPPAGGERPPPTKNTQYHSMTDGEDEKGEEGDEEDIEEEEGEEEEGEEEQNANETGKVSADASDPAARVTKAITHAKSYGKVTVPKFPSPGTVTNWLIQLGINLCLAGGFVDHFEIK